MRTSLTRKWLGPLALLLTGCVLAATPTPSVQAEGLPKFTGYTLPGSLGEPAKAAEGKPVRLEKDGLGATILYAVFDRADGRPGDVFNTGIAGLEENFIPGKDVSGQVGARKLDTQARYLYLYQVVNDSGRESVVRTATIRLLVDPQLITSYGYFFKPQGAPKDNEPQAGVGIGFAQEYTLPKINDGKPVMLPISTEHPVAKDRKYVDGSKYYLAPKLYRTSQIGVGNGIKVIEGPGGDPTGASEDRGRAPEEVMLLSSAVFEGPPKTHILGTGMGFGSGVSNQLGFGAPISTLYNPFCTPYSPLSMYGSAAPFYGPRMAYSPYPMMGSGMYNTAVAPVAYVAPTTPGVSGTRVRGVAAEEESNRSPALRAFFLDNPLKSKERSTLFGFTSDYPPTYEDVRVRGNSGLAIRAVGFGDPNLREAALTADGEVPTPIAFDNGGAGTASVGGVGFGGVGTMSGMSGGGGGSFGGTGAGLPTFGAGVGSTGGGSGSGTPTGGSGSTSSPTQQQQETPTTTTTTPAVNVSTPVTVTQSNTNQQQQQQQQQQKQRQSSHNTGSTTPSAVVPEPAAMIAALLGLPVFLLFTRRKKTPAPQTPGDNDEMKV